MLALEVLEDGRLEVVKYEIIDPAARDWPGMRPITGHEGTTISLIAF
jgi:hypothetical protein